MSLIKILLVLFSFSSVAADYCSLQPSVDNLEIRIDEPVSYFFKVHPDGSHLAFIGDENNLLIDIASGEISPIPGKIDPVFSHDGKYLVAPITTDDGHKVNYFNFKDIKKHGEDAKSVHADFNNRGVYQSLGESKGGGYKLITDLNKMTLTTFKDGKSSKVVNPCANIKDRGSNLPIISMDGDYLSILDTKTDKTKIYHLKDNGSCELALDLGYATGKISFNKDSSQIAFHVDHVEDSHDGDYFSSISGDITKDVYVMNVEKVGHSLVPTGIAKVTNTDNLEEGAYYPTFDKEGNVYYLKQGEQERFSFHRVAQDKLKFEKYSPELGVTVEKHVLAEHTEDGVLSNGCTEQFRKEASAIALGALWSNICLRTKARDTDYLLFAKGLDGEACRELVENYWGSEFFKSLMSDDTGVLPYFFDSLGFEDLLAVCPKVKDDNLKNSSEEKLVHGQWTTKENAPDFNKLIDKKCLRCHKSEMEYEREVPIKNFYNEKGELVKSETEKRKFKLPSFQSKDFSYEELIRITFSIFQTSEARRMPRGGRLSSSERKSVLYKYEELYLAKKIDTSAEEIEEIFAEVMEKINPKPHPVTMVSNEFFEDALVNATSSLESMELPNTEKTRLKAKAFQMLKCLLQHTGCDTYLPLAIAERKEAIFYDENGNQLPRKSDEDIEREVRCELYIGVTQRDCRGLSGFE